MLQRSPGLLLVVLLIVFFPTPSHAYIDPGSGYLFTQILISFAVASFFFVPRQLSRLWKAIRRKS